MSGPKHPPSPDYVPGPEHPPLPDYVPGPKYPEYLDTSGLREDDMNEKKMMKTMMMTDDDDDYDERMRYDEMRRRVEDTEAFETKESAHTPTHTSPTYVEAPLGYRAAMIRSRAASPSPVPSPRLHRARISVRPQTPMSVATEALIAVVAVALPSSPPPSPLTPLSSPLP
ncbi:hypothetical protein Tco_0815514 [Tanacetum coccineum]